jgi:hypothetical protein
MQTREIVKIIELRTAAAKTFGGISWVASWEFVASIRNVNRLLTTGCQQVGRIGICGAYIIEVVCK